MAKTLLHTLIEQNVMRGAATTFATESDRIGEELAREILREPAFREQIRVLAKRAFARVLDDLGKPARPSRRRRASKNGRKP
jgi:hypothetical protein